MEYKLLMLALGIFLLAAFSFQTAYSTTLSCEGLTPAACKTKFGEEFEEKYKNIYIKAQEDILKEISANFKEAETQISSEEDRNTLKKYIDELDDEMKNLHEYKDNYPKLFEIVNHIYTHLHEPKELSEALQTIVREISLKRKTEKTITGIRRQELIDIEDTWADYYNGLRPEDKEYYTRYDELNEAQLNFQEGCMKAFGTWTKGLATDFDLPFFKTLVEARSKDF